MGVVKRGVVRKPMAAAHMCWSISTVENASGVCGSNANLTGS